MYDLVGVVKEQEILQVYVEDVLVQLFEFCMGGGIVFQFGVQGGVGEFYFYVGYLVIVQYEQYVGYYYVQCYVGDEVIVGYYCYDQYDQEIIFVCQMVVVDQLFIEQFVIQVD